MTAHKIAFQATRKIARNFALLVAFVIALCALCLQASAQPAEIYTDSKKQAAQGYDVVSYFTAGKPIKGKADFKTEWKGALWLFTSEKHLASFKANPEKYAPQYGGYCAWAIANNYTARGSAKDWNIVDGKLYLNYNSSVRRTWQKDARGNIKKANNYWPKILNR